jgi:hypothetical protein
MSLDVVQRILGRLVADDLDLYDRRAEAHARGGGEVSRAAGQVTDPPMREGTAATDSRGADA